MKKTRHILKDTFGQSSYIYISERTRFLPTSVRLLNAKSGRESDREGWGGYNGGTTIIRIVNINVVVLCCVVLCCVVLCCVVLCCVVLCCVVLCCVVLCCVVLCCVVLCCVVLCCVVLCCVVLCCVVLCCVVLCCVVINIYHTNFLLGGLLKVIVLY